MTDGSRRDVLAPDGAAPPGPVDRPTAGARFPHVEARSLSGRAYRLPVDLGGALNAVLVGFDVGHQAGIDSWLPTLEAFRERRPDVHVYEFVPIPRFLLPTRPTIDGGMAAGIGSEAVRARTLTAYLDLPPLLGALGLPDAGESALFLVAPDGSILWQTRGGFDAAGAASLARALDLQPLGRGQAGARGNNEHGGERWPT